MTIEKYQENNKMGSEGEFSNEKLMEVILDVRNKLNENTQSIAKLTTSIEEIKEQHTDIKTELMSLKTNAQAQIKALEASQQSITDNQKFLNGEFEEYKVRLDAAEERSKSAEANIIKSKADMQIIHEDLLTQQNNINSLEQYGRRNMLEINNIPEKDNENLKSIITAIASEMNLEEFNYNADVDIAHRLQCKLPISPIIVLFNNRTRRNEYYQKRKLLKGTTLKDLKELNFTENQPIFINESLTLFNRILLKKVREACKKQHYKIFWTSNGISMCKKNVQSDVVIIKNERDIERIK